MYAYRPCQLSGGPVARGNEVTQNVLRSKGDCNNGWCRHLCHWTGTCATRCYTRVIAKKELREKTHC
jgi:hypothetical protein